MRLYQPTKDRRIKKRGEVYWARFMMRGVYVQESLSTKSFQIAVRMVEEIEQSILLGVKWRKDKELFDTAWDQFLEDKAKGIKTQIARDRTLMEYVNFGERYFLPHFKDTRLADIDEEAWGKFVEWVREQNPTIIFFNLRKYLGAFLTWSEKKGKIQKRPELYNPDARKDLESDEEEGPGKAYTVSELAKMGDWSSRHSLEFHLYILMGGRLGMRSSEITQLRKDRIDGNLIRLRPIDTKTKSARVIPIPKDVAAPLAIQMKLKSKYLFPNFRKNDGDRPMDPTGFKKPWTALREELGIDGRFHDLRHTFITNALAKGMNPVVVSKIVGTSIKVLEKVYLHLRDEDLIAEMNRL